MKRKYDDNLNLEIEKDERFGNLGGEINGGINITQWKRKDSLST